MNCKQCKHSALFNYDDKGICTNPVKNIYEVIILDDGEVVHHDFPPPEVTEDNCCNQFEEYIK